MKNRLLAVFLTFTAISCFAAKPSDTELLVHLKKLHIEAQNILQALSESEAKLQQDLSQEFFLFLSAVWEEISITPPFSEKYNKQLNFLFNALCNNNKKISDIEELINHHRESETISNDNEATKEDMIKEYRILKKILLKQYKHYQTKYPNLELFNCNHIECSCFMDILVADHGICNQKKIYSDILKKIDAKIAKLEAQL